MSAAKKKIIGDAVEVLVQRARHEVIEACRENFDELPDEVKDRMRIFTWVDEQSYPELENE